MYTSNNNNQAGGKMCPHPIRRLHLSGLSDHIATIIILLEEKKHDIARKFIGFYWLFRKLIHSANRS